MNAEEITPRELKPALLQLDGISRVTMEAHHRLYQGYVNKRNEILRALAAVDLAGANQVYSEFRSLKVDLTFAIGAKGRDTDRDGVPDRADKCPNTPAGAVVGGPGPRPRRA